jgi:UDP-N-acetyl-D-mannosaminuronic acid dehydrogenase
MKNINFEKICVVGLGYIGLPTAVMFASKGKTVLGLDINSNVNKSINSGRSHIEEPMLDELLKTVVEKGYLSAQIEPEEADAFIIAVPTPFEVMDDGSHAADMKFINLAADNIAKVLKSGDLLILESTSPVGTTEKLVASLQALRPDLSFPNATTTECDVNVAYCPERVLPGQIVNELVKNDRIIGGITRECAAAAVKLYQIFVEAELITTDVKTAEMSKLTENACRDVQIAFANELSILCDG